MSPFWDSRHTHGNKNKIMRTKSLFAAAAILAGGAVASFGQGNVYSLNIVGYINVELTSGSLHLLSNPLKPSEGNYSVNNIVKLQDAGSDGTTLFKWDGSQWIPVGYIEGFGWDTEVDINHGEGFFIQPTLTQTITFVGEVATGDSATAISGALSLLGSKIPVAGPVPGSTTGNDGDTIFTWNVAANSWVPTGFIEGFGWDGDNVEGPVVQVGEGFFYQNTGSTVNWVQTLNP